MPRHDSGALITQSCSGRGRNTRMICEHPYKKTLFGQGGTMRKEGNDYIVRRDFDCRKCGQRGTMNYGQSVILMLDHYRPRVSSLFGERHENTFAE